MGYPRVFIESPYNGTPEEIKRNVNYAILAMQDCLLRKEAPFASHLMYTQTREQGFVSDDDEVNKCVGREAAIEAAMSWGLVSEKTVVYQDYGITRGMKYGIANAEKAGRPIEYRNILIQMSSK